jgi:hypothetical protein
LPLWLEPAGSVFVVFRKSNNADTKQVVALERNGQSVLPGRGQAFKEPPVAELTAGRNQEISLRAWLPGRYDLRKASGKVQSVEVPVLPPPLEIAGPWEVRFEPNRGAPERTTFDKLISWSDHSDPGVKYFSGAATYRKTFAWKSEKPQASALNSQLFLDLGRVEVMAEVKLNGKDLGILWKPPYRVEVTDALKAGENVLELQIVNLWVNRQIGDEQLPEDSDRNPDGTLKQWPQWLFDGKPSPTGRYTYTSWRLWKKNDALLESGLIGPVEVFTVETVKLK